MRAAHGRDLGQGEDDQEQDRLGDGVEGEGEGELAFQRPRLAGDPQPALGGEAQGLEPGDQGERRQDQGDPAAQASGTSR